MNYKEKIESVLKRFTQQEVADLLNVTNRSIQNYISDDAPTKPYPKTQRRIDEIYQSLIIEKRPLEDFKASHAETKPANDVSETRLNKKNSGEQPSAPFIPIKAQAGYVKAYDQTVFVDTLEKYALPPGVNPHGAVWRYWEVEGESMEPSFHSGDIILTSQVHQMDWENLRNFYLYVIVTDEKVMLKRIFCKNPLEWVLISENEDQYPQQLIPTESVKEVWVFRRSILNNAKPTKQFEIKV